MLRNIYLLFDFKKVMLQERSNHSFYLVAKEGRNSSRFAIVITQNNLGIGVAHVLEERRAILVRDEHEVFTMLIDREDGD